MKEPTIKLLIADDEPFIYAMCEHALGTEGYELTSVTSGEACLRCLEQEVFDLVLLDYRMPGLDGIEVLRRIREGADPDVGVVIITGFGTLDSALEAFRLGVQDFLTKPLRLETLERAIQRSLEATKIRRHLRHFAREGQKAAPLAGLVGESPAMQQVVETLLKVAASPLSSVLITGETGTGKNLVARVLHECSPRAAGPFVQVNCTTLPANLVEVELFGAEKGAFTDAHERKVGRVEQADGGTLFLDEIGHMPWDLQPKLLNVLEEKRFRRVGGQGEVSVDVRFAASTNRDLEQAVRDGQFRMDLYFRLYIVPIHLPPLRERGEDILLLARHFLHALGRDLEKPRRDLSPEAEALLRAYPWPGNVRELRNVMERAVLLSKGEVLTAADLSFLSGTTPRGQAPGPALTDLGRPRDHETTRPPRETTDNGPRDHGTTDPESGVRGPGSGVRGLPKVVSGPDERHPLQPVSLDPAHTSLEEMERAHILRVLQETKGNKVQAAQILGISRETLRRKLMRWGEE
jgi:DNA-binding NtrC family response regulator